MADRCVRIDSSRCDPSRITLDLLSQVIWLGSQLEESFLTHLSTIQFSLVVGQTCWLLNAFRNSCRGWYMKTITLPMRIYYLKFI